MKYCSECGIPVENFDKFCPKCGHSLSKNVESAKTAVRSHEIWTKHKKIIFIAVAIIAMALGAFLLKQFLMDSNETLAYKNCLALKAMMKDPDSFKLYDNIVILERSGYGDTDATFTYTVIEYGGANSYGGIIKSTAIFVGNRYLSDYDELAKDKSSASYTEELRAWLALKEFQNGDDGTKVIEINTDKMKSKLGLE